MVKHNTLSSYLVQPDLTPRRERNWAGFRTQIIQISRANPQIATKTFVALMIWCALFASIRYVTSPHSLPGQGSAVSASATAPTAVLQPTLSKTAPAALATVVHAQALPSGPSGQLMPPGVMAPPYTYPNSYSHGQCTWYVAGRRQVPPNWGNARNWYYHAISSGWSTGTVPAYAAIAWTPAGTYGHVAVVEEVSADGQQVRISEMNYRGLGVIDSRWVSSISFKYIY